MGLCGVESLLYVFVPYTSKGEDSDFERQTASSKRVVMSSDDRAPNGSHSTGAAVIASTSFVGVIVAAASCSLVSFGG